MRGQRPMGGPRRRLLWSRCRDRILVYDVPMDLRLIALSSLFLASVGACDPAPPPITDRTLNEPCTETSHCIEGLECIYDHCADPNACTRWEHVCGEACCQAEEQCVEGECVTFGCTAGLECGTGCCVAGETCIEGLCCGPSSVCGGDCCNPDESCIDGACLSCPRELCDGVCCLDWETCHQGSCCTTESICGDACCAEGAACLLSTCVPDCLGSNPCGPTGACCEAGTETCYLGDCVSPGEECGELRACSGEDRFCALSLGRCLPLAETEACELASAPGTDGPNLTVVDFAASRDGCPSTLTISVRVVNVGAASAPAGLFVTFRKSVGSSGATGIGVASTSAILGAGQSEVLSLAYSLDASEVDSFLAFEAQVDIDSAGDMAVEECDEDDNLTATVTSACLGS